MSEGRLSLYGLHVLSHCGAGAYGDVYYCQDVSGKRVALKVISKIRLGSGWERELKGITNYRRLTEGSPFLMNIFHVGEDETSFYYTMEPADPVPGVAEYVPDTLARRLESGGLVGESLLSVLGDLMSAILVLHEAGFAHRDIKPENILFIDGKPRLADLGLLSPLTGTMTQLAGTLDFLPPEERSGESPADSKGSRQRNDLYAFGKIIYCCITGNGADQFPSMPRDIPLTLQNKLFFRLVMRLCDKDPSRRLTRLRDVVAAFDDTVRMCRHGESLFDKLRYGCSALCRGIASSASHLFKSAVRHWLLVLIGIALLGGTFWRLWHRQLPDITKIETKPYRSESAGLEMTIPKEWEVISNATAKEWLAMDDEELLSEEERKRREHLAEILEQGGEFIVYDYGAPYSDMITIQSAPIPGEELVNAPDDALQDIVLQLHKGKPGYDTKIHDYRRMILAGHPCIYIDLSHTPDTRICSYLVAMKDRCVVIMLNAESKTYQVHREQLQSALYTLRFDQKDGKAAL